LEIDIKKASELLEKYGNVRNAIKNYNAWVQIWKH
jgi:hypothetical protein